MDGYRAIAILSEKWEDRVELFFALESLERVSSEEAREYLSRM